MSWGKYSKRDFNWGNSTTSCYVGPGSYDVDPPKTKVKHCCKTTFGQSKEKRNPWGQKLQKTPDPGAYELQVTGLQGRCIASAFQSRSARSPYDIHEGPSPSDHGQLNDWNPKARRRISTSNGRVPMPYSPNIGQKVEGYVEREDGTMQPIIQQTKDFSYLGPGSYAIQNPKSSRAHSMCSDRPISCLVEKEHINVPGPGQYDPRFINSKLPPNIPESAPMKLMDTPKSGNLTHGDLTSRRNGTSNFKSKTKRELWKKPNEYPGPETYQNKTQVVKPKRKKELSGPEPAFGSTTPRFGDPANDTPGPGQYEAKNVRWLKDPKSTMPKAVYKYDPSNGVPGPGSYEQESSIRLKGTGPSPPFANTQTRKLVDLGPDTPGPAGYKICDRPSSRGMTMRKDKINRAEFLDIREGPSPVDYRVMTAPSGVRAQALSRAVRFQTSRNDTPGPGTYNVDHQHDNLIKMSYNSDLVGLKSMV